MNVRQTVRPRADAFGPSMDPAPDRIAIVSHSHPSLSKGGAEIAAYTLFTGLTSLGHDVIFITACQETDRGRLALGSDREFAVFYNPAVYDHLYHLSCPTVTAQLLTILDENHIDLVNFQHFFHFGLGSVRAVAADDRRRVFVTLHEFLAICYHHGQMITRPTQLLCQAASPQSCASCFPENTTQQFALRKSLFRKVFAQVDGFISPSAFLADRFVAWGLDPARITVIENGLAHRPPRTPAVPQSDEGPWIFGFFGQINPFKGVETILNAIRLIPKSSDLRRRIQVRLHGNIIGQSEKFVKLLNETVEQNDFLSFEGPYNNALVAKLMGECHYVMVPSRWWENSPVVIQEAYAVGRPVIATGIGGMAEKVIDGVCGLHMRLGDAADMVRVWELAAKAETFARLCAGVPPVYDAAEMARSYIQFFGDLSPDGADHAQIPTMRFGQL